jgi:hypothetical protein
VVEMTKNVLFDICTEDLIGEITRRYKTELCVMDAIDYLENEVAAVERERQKK